MSDLCCLSAVKQVDCSFAFHSNSITNCLLQQRRMNVQLSIFAIMHCDCSCACNRNSITNCPRKHRCMNVHCSLLAITQIDQSWAFQWCLINNCPRPQRCVNVQLLLSAVMEIDHSLTTHSHFNHKLFPQWQFWIKHYWKAHDWSICLLGKREQWAFMQRCFLGQFVIEFSVTRCLSQ